MKILFSIFILSACFWIGIANAQNGVVKSYYPNGNVQSETSYVNDVLDGAAITYFQDGKINTEKNYSQGVLNGFVREYYESGKLKLEYFARMGVKDGAYRIYNSEGILTELISYDSGQVTKKEIFEAVPSEIAAVEKPVIKQEEPVPQKSGRNNEMKAAAIEKKEEFSDKKTEAQKREETELLSKVKTETSLAFKPEEGYEEILCDVQECPEPVGGMKTIQQNLIYPEHALLYGIEGTVKIIATINQEGRVTRTQVLKGIGYGCDEEAQIAIRKTKFTPGKQNGLAAETNATISVAFKIPGKR